MGSGHSQQFIPRREAENYVRLQCDHTETELRFQYLLQRETFFSLIRGGLDEKDVMRLAQEFVPGLKIFTSVVLSRHRTFK